MKSSLDSSLPCTTFSSAVCAILWRRVQLFMWLAFSMLATSLWSQSYSFERTFMHGLGLEMNVKTIIKDKAGFLWIGSTHGLYRYDGAGFELLGSAYNKDVSLQHPQVTALFEDSKQNLWIGTPEGVHVLTSGRDKLLFSPLLSTEKGGLREPVDFMEKSERVWAADLSNTIGIYTIPGPDADTIRLERTVAYSHWSMNTLFPLKSGEVLAGYNHQYYLLLDSSGGLLAEHLAPVKYQGFVQNSNGDLLAVSTKGLYKVDVYENRFDQVFSFQGILEEPSAIWICTYPEDSLRGIWLGSSIGQLIRYDMVSGTLEDFSESLRNRIFDERFYANYAGYPADDGGLWLGTSQGVVHLYQPNQDYFEVLPLPEHLKAPMHFSIRGMIEMRDGSILAGSYSGLFRYFEDGSVREYAVNSPETGVGANPLAYDFFAEGDRIWIASEGNSLLAYDYSTDALKRVVEPVFFDTIGVPEYKVAMWLTSVCRTHEGRLWLGSVNGLFYLGEDSQPSLVDLDDDHPLKYARIFHMAEGPDSVLWIGCNLGLFSYSPDRAVLKEHKITDLASIAIPHFLLNPDGTMWLATSGEGFKLYHPRTNRFESFSSIQGLPNNNVYALQVDADSTLWISTNSGLARFDPETQVFSSFHIQDGLPDNEFNQNAYLTDSRGRMYFGGVSGIVRFNPGFKVRSDGTNALRVSKISWHDGKAGETKYNVFGANIDPEIRLGPKDKYFTIFYSSKNLRPGSVSNSAYRLVGLHSDWQLNGSQNYVQFTNLRPGRYTLQIKEVTGALSQDSPVLAIPVFVARPLGKTWWAYTLYALFAAGLGFILFREYFAGLHMRNRLRLELEHSEKLEEINRSKSTFFANITHEFKTPLTLIQGPAEEIQSRTGDEKIRDYARLISKNANAILGLVTQLLDLSKLEANLEEPQFYRIDLASSFRVWVSRFEQHARQKKIDMQLDIETDALYMDCDPVKIETVCNNLLSNALKFTPGGGSVIAGLRQVENSGGKTMAEIYVQDTGHGIPEHEQTKIFERFFQGTNSVLGGTGIGLAFVRELVKLHNGQVFFTSEEGKGSRFTVQLPVEQEQGHLDIHEIQVEMNGEEVPTFKGRKPMPAGSEREEDAYILIAEDHADIAELISDTLTPFYNVQVCENGKLAHEQAIRTIPDLLITDVMMPVLDGFRLTQMLKQDVHTNHIPIIMLTAKDGQESRMEGRMHGADIYLNKPFSPKELLLSVRNLMQLRANLMQHASRTVETDVRALDLKTDMDKAFYARFLDELELRMDRAELSQTEMLEAMGMSRTQLHRKLKAITGQSYSEIVRSVRLQKALSLLRHSGMNVAEVAYAVGYSAPSYFSESFKEYFGYTPSDARQSSGKSG